MRFTIKTKDFQTVLGRVNPCISNRTTLPILGHVRLDVAGTILEASATDCDIWIDAVTDCKSTEGGEVCVPFKKLSDAVALFKGESVTVTASNGACLVECGQSRIKLPVMDASEYPEGQKIEAQPVLTSGLPEKFKRLVPFCSDSPTKGVLQGVMIQAGLACACEGVALLEEKVEGLPNMIIPARAAHTVAGWTGEVSVRTGQGIAEFSGDEITLRTKLVEGNAVDWKRVIPEEEGKLLTFTRVDLTKALRLLVTQCDDAKLANVSLTPRDGGFNASLMGSEAASESIDSLTPLPMPIALSMRRLLTVLGAFEGEVISLSIIDDRTPLVIRQEDRIAVQNLTRFE